MPRFRAGVVRAAPLMIQLTAGSKQLEVLGWWAFTEGQGGAVSRPVLSRPSKPGLSPTAHPARPALDAPGTTATADVLTSFYSSPSLPDVKVFSHQAPLLVEERWEVGSGVIVEPGESVLLYSLTERTGEVLPGVDGEFDKGGQEWTADIEWREL